MRPIVSSPYDIPVVRSLRAAVPFAGSLLLGALLGYLLLRRVVDPGFTHFWGYQVAQVTVTLGILLIGDALRGRGTLWSWETRAIVVGTTYADCFGTAGHFYDRFEVYDKITHLAGSAAIAALCYEAVEFLRQQEIVGDAIASPVIFAICFSIFIGIAWEVYEYLGDAMFHTKRMQSWNDTFHDLFSDTAGAVIAGLLVSRRATRGAVEPTRQLATGSHSLRRSDDSTVASRVNADLP